MKKYPLVYVAALTIPAMLALVSWQSTRYMNLERELAALEAEQEEYVETNNRLIAQIAMLSSPERIAYVAREQFGLIRIRPEDVLQIKIAGEGEP
ncbi:MAG: cell division protein FtsL [Treponema sp.]|jgi:cell division protein FtsL|nr:cell division protein FtsL [Treponema sp.]